MLLSAGLLLASPALAANYQVSNTNDSGAGSLREAINQANANAGPDTITFASSVTGTINLTSSSLYIQDSVQIQGPGASVLTVDGSNIVVAPPAQDNGTQGQSSAASIFQIAPQSQAKILSRISGLTTGGPPPAIDVSISGLTMTGGNAKYGGAIAAAVTNLAVNDCVITGNTATAAGGGIFSFTKYGSLNVSDSVISNNQVTGSTGSSGPFMTGGGGISTFLQDTTINRSTISGNTAPAGGGILLQSYYATTATAQGATGGTPPPSATVLISNSTLSGNTAYGLGGGYLTTLHDAMTGGGPYLSGIGGGALSLASNIQIVNTTVTGNSATDLGGGLALGSANGSSAMVGNSTIVGNSATNYGGGLVVNAYYAAAPTVANTVIGGNSAPSQPDVSTSGSPGADPGIDLAYSLVQTPGTAVLNDNGGNLFNQAPLLGGLGNNGGPTLTLLPQAGSPLINAGDPGFSGLAFDQRGPGYDRVVNGRVDIGATEFGAGSTTPGGGYGYTPVPGLGDAGKFGLGALLGLVGLAVARRRRHPASRQRG